MRRLQIVIFLIVISIANIIPPNAHIRGEYSNIYTTTTGTEIRVNITFPDTAKTGIVFPINFTIELISLGEEIYDIHDIEVGISIEAPGRLFSPYFYQLSKMDIALDNETKSTYIMFYWMPDSFWMQLGPGQSIEVTIKFYIGFRENKPHAIDPHSEIGWQSCGTIKVEFYKDTTNYPLLIILCAMPIIIIGIIIWLIHRRRKKTMRVAVKKQEKETVIIREKVMIRCPYCGGLVEQGATSCPHCGAKL